MRPLVGTSTKMNLTSSEAEEYFATLCPLVAAITECDLFVLPPFTSIWVARASLRNSNVAWGAQDVHHDDAGAHTGDISAPMLADLGCSFAEVGHSERGRDHGETDELIASKAAQVIRHGMTPIVCVGEQTRVPTDEALDLVLGQLGRRLRMLPSDARIVVAYEPVWAIGSGAAPAAPRHVSTILGGIHGRIGSLTGTMRDSRVIYGGSVDLPTVEGLRDVVGLDGLFVGRAGLDPRRFAAIAREVQDRGLGGWRAQPDSTAPARIS